MVYYTPVPMICPDCKYECTDNAGVNISVGNTDLDGTYCPRCRARDIARTTSKMVRKEGSP